MDLIDRQQAIDAIDKRFDDVPMELTTEILQLRHDLRERIPSAQPATNCSEIPNSSDDTISRQAAIDAVDAIGHIATMPDGDKCIRRSAVKYTLSMLPSAQTVATDTNVGDMISRQAAIDIIEAGRLTKLIDAETAVNGLKGLPSAQPEPPCYLGSPCEYQNPDVVISQPEPSIPLSWIEEHIEWLKSLDNEFANLAATHISVMAKKWRGEQE